MKKRKYTWFVKPLDEWTNGVISKKLPAEEFSEEIKNIRDLWRCPDYSFVDSLLRNQKALKLEFKIYNQEDSGKIRECSFLQKKKGRR